MCVMALRSRKKMREDFAEGGETGRKNVPSRRETELDLISGSRLETITRPGQNRRREKEEKEAAKEVWLAHRFALQDRLNQAAADSSPLFTGRIALLGTVSTLALNFKEAGEAGISDASNDQNEPAKPQAPLPN